MPSFHKAGEILILPVIADEKIFLYGFYGTVQKFCGVPRKLCKRFT